MASLRDRRRIVEPTPVPSATPAFKLSESPSRDEEDDEENEEDEEDENEVLNTMLGVQQQPATLTNANGGKKGSPWMQPVYRGILQNTLSPDNIPLPDGVSSPFAYFCFRVLMMFEKAGVSPIDPSFSQIWEKMGRFLRENPKRPTTKYNSKQLHNVAGQFGLTPEQLEQAALIFRQQNNVQ